MMDTTKTEYKNIKKKVFFFFLDQAKAFDIVIYHVARVLIIR